MKFDVKIAEHSDKTLWNGFLEKHTPETHALDWRWREIIEKTFGHKPYYLIAKTKEEVLGILPLFHFRSRLFGNSMASLPYLNEGGIKAENQDVFNAILEEASSLSQGLSCKYVELRHRDQLSSQPSELVERQHKVAMRLELLPDEDEMFKTFPAKLRSQIRRPGKSGLVAKISSEDLSIDESTDAFYTVFSEHMRDLGTPVYPKTLFENSVKSFTTKARVITVWDGVKPVAAGITIGCGRCTEIPWASSLRSYNKQSPNMLLYWATIKQAIRDEYRVFDFGRSNVNSGTLRFKKQWGSKEKPLFWYYSLNNSDAPDVNPNSTKFELMVKCWQKLPLPLANSLGPKITRWIP